MNFLKNNISLGEDLIHKAIDNFHNTENYPELSSCYKLLLDSFSELQPEKAQIYRREYNRYKLKLVG